VKQSLTIQDCFVATLLAMTIWEKSDAMYCEPLASISCLFVRDVKSNWTPPLSGYGVHKLLLVAYVLAMAALTYAQSNNRIGIIG
jgi:hypothetical protein